jgi:hypothetical protein
MSENFHLIDLRSQVGAVRRLLAGKTDTEKLAWLASRGTLDLGPMVPDGRQIYRFESVINREAAFFFDAGDLVFVGDHSTSTACDE